MSDVPPTIGRYKIDRVIGRGGMGVVYRARTPQGEPVALKAIAHDLIAGDTPEVIVARFEREVSIGQHLDHPGIVKVLDHGEDRDDLFMVMELVEGETLHQAAGGRPRMRQLIDWMLQLLHGLGYAHEHGVIHRDIKFGNIMVTASEQVKLMDFGIAHLAGSELTQNADFLGSPAYMAPEQMSGGVIDARTDLYAVGVILFRLLTGKPPFSGTLAKVMHDAMMRPAPLPSTLSQTNGSFDPIVAKALAKSPADRFSSAGQFAEALSAVSGTGSVATAPQEDDVTVYVASSPRQQQTTEADLVNALNEAISVGVTAQRGAGIRRMLKSGVSISPAMARQIDDSVVVPLADRALEAVPAPDSAPVSIPGNWMATIQVVADLAEAANDLNLAEAPEARDQIVAALLGAVLSYRRRFAAALDADEPDLARLSIDLLRLDVLHEAIECLGAPAAAARTALAQRQIAGKVMATVNDIVARFTETGDALARFGVANLLVEVEELVVIADRLLVDAPGPANEDDIAGAVIDRFLDLAGQLSDAVVAELADEVARGSSDVKAFDQRLRQLGLIYLFATRLRGGGKREKVRQLVDRTHAAVNRLAAALNKALTAGLAEVSRRSDGPAPNDLQAAARVAFAQLTAVFDLAERFGWIDLRRRLLADLRSRLIENPELSTMLDA